jgi:transaldolase
MKPPALKTKIFLDGGDEAETKEIQNLLGFLDGQTTNPTLISKNPEVKNRLEKGEKFSEKDALSFYRRVVESISARIPQGSISVEVYSDPSTRADEMLAQGREMFAWIPNAHVKFPSSKQGLEAAHQAVKEGLRVNMTLCFSQEQAAAVYAATHGAKKGEVFVSPFIGRLDDRGENGMDLIRNVLSMYQKGHGHVEVLTASVRKLDHLLYALKLGSHIVTAPFKILGEWAEQGLPIPGEDYEYHSGGLKEIPYENIVLTKAFSDYSLAHDLTVKGMEKFSADWARIIEE